MTSLFGDWKSARLLEEAALSTLKLWMETYVREAERQFDRTPESMPLPESYQRVKEFDKWPEDKLPAIMVLSPGLDGTRPKKDGDGKYRAWFVLGVGIAIKGRDKARVNDLIKDYTAAVRALLVQHGKLGGYADGIEWRDESHNVANTEDQQRTLGTAQIMFTVEVKDVVQWGAGPVVVPGDPLNVPGYGTVQSTEETILNVKELEGE